MFEVAPLPRTGPITPSSSGRAPSEATGGRAEWHRGPMTSRNRLGRDSFRSIPIVGVGRPQACPRCGSALQPTATGEDKPLYPTSIYAITKRDHEEMAIAFGQAYELPAVALRFFNIYGSRQALTNPYTGVAAIFSARMLARQAPVVYEDGFEYQFGRARILQEGADVAIVACGILVPEALRAAESLRRRGVKASVIDLNTIKPLDGDVIEKYARRCGRVVTAEEHNIMGGMGSAVAEILVESYPVPLRRVGVRDTFGESGEAPELMKKYGLTAANIEEAALAVRGKN